MDTPIRKYARANFLDYSEGAFFVTICTKNKASYFGYIQNQTMHLSQIGQFLDENIKSIPQHHSFAEVLNYVIMPNHVHMIISLANDDDNPRQTADNLGRLNQLARLSVATGRDPTMTTHHNSRLAIVVGSMKAAVTRFAKSLNLEFGWQARFHDHRIRGSRDGDNIWNYINNNVIKWQTWQT